MEDYIIIINYQHIIINLIINGKYYHNNYLIKLDNIVNLLIIYLLLIYLVNMEHINMYKLLKY